MNVRKVPKTAERACLFVAGALAAPGNQELQNECVCSFHEAGATAKEELHVG